jgi:AraC-like DNA-binding protein
MIYLGRGRFFGETVSAERFGRIVITASRYRAGNSLPRHCHEQAYLFADAIGVHRAHLCREFRRHCGCTMTQYAGRLRADLALDGQTAGESQLL